MLHEVAVGGLLLPPMLGLILVTIGLFTVAHWQLEKYDIYRFFWHPALAAAAFFVVILGVLLALYGIS